MIIETDRANETMSVRVVTDVMGLDANSMVDISNILRAYSSGIDDIVTKYMNAHPSSILPGCSVCGKGPATLVKNVTLLNHHLRVQVFTTRKDGKSPRLCRQHYSMLLHIPLWYQIQETSARLITAIHDAKKGKK